MYDFSVQNVQNVRVESRLSVQCTVCILDYTVEICYQSTLSVKCTVLDCTVEICYQSTLSVKCTVYTLDCTAEVCQPEYTKCTVYSLYLGLCCISIFVRV